MNYNKSEIMKKANALRARYGMNKSEALAKAWGMAKIANLEKELFELNLYSPTGGANNIIAQNEIRTHNEKIEKVTAKIENIKNAIYPRITATGTRTLDMYDRNRIMRRINSITMFSPSLTDELAALEQQLAHGVEAYTYETLDTGAYNAA